MDRHTASVHRGPRGRAFRACSLAIAGVLWAAIATAQGAPPAQQEARPTGLPAASGLDWTFNFDASWGTFGFMNSLYTNPKPEQPSGDLGDGWFEGAAKPAVTATYTSSKSAWQLYGKASVVGERTYGAAPTLVGEDASSYQVEDLHVGWRSGKALGGLGENALEFTVGRAQYTLGHAFLLWDGAAEGGTRGGYWSNARKAWEFAGIARFKPGPHTFEGFYLDKDDMPEADIGSRLWGLNYQLALGGATTLGASYLKVYAHADKAPQRDRLNVYNARVFTSPLPKLPGLALEGEYVREDNGNALDSYAWTAQAGYELAMTWKPRLSYRYAFFQGDDPSTSANEAYDPLFLGFYDWGAWWQGEIGGEYFLSNSNLISHQVRLHTSPIGAIGTGLIFYDFLFHRPEAVGPGVTSDKVAVELDWYLDWKLNRNFTVSLVGAFANPGEAVKQAYDRTKNFTYGMIWIAYSY